MYNFTFHRPTTVRQAAGLLNAWSGEDVYVPLDAEIKLLREAGFDADVIWRKGSFAVLLAVI